MLYKKLHSLLLIVFITATLFPSCRKDKGPSWDVAILAPILKSTLGVEHFAADSLVQVNPDNTISIVYDGNLVKLSLDTLVEIPDTNIQETFFAPGNMAPLNPGDAIPLLGNLVEETKYKLKGVELKMVKILSGTLSFSLSSSIREVTELSYQMPYVSKMGIPFSINESIPAGTQANPSIISKSYDLSGYKIDLTGVNQNDFNTIVANLSVIISPAAPDTVAIMAMDRFDIQYSFNSLKVEYASGYFGSYDINDGNVDTINIFKKIKSGSFNLDSIGMSLNIKNGFGIDAQLVIDTLGSINTSTSNTVLLNHQSVGNAINLSRAQNTPNDGKAFTYAEYNMVINTNNSNTDALIENIPDQMKYDFTILINPFGNNSNGNDFLYHNSDLQVNLNLEVPLAFSANGLTILDTVEVAFSTDSEENTSTIIDGFLHLYADNGFPYEATIQVYLYDEVYQIIDSLVMFPGNRIIAAPVDLNNKVTGKFLSKIDLPVNEEKISNLENAKKALVRVVFSTSPNNQILKIYEDYEMDLKLIADFTYRISSK